jgi:glutathione S-transferase
VIAAPGPGSIHRRCRGPALRRSGRAGMVRPAGVAGGVKEVVMKLYFAPGACSLSPHIVLREAGAKFELEQVNNQEKKTKSGVDYWTINGKGQVPVLEFDGGERLTEGPVIVQWIADQNPASGLVPPAGKPERYRVQEWLNFVTSELHKSFGPIFRPTTPDAYKAISKENLGKRFDWLDKQLAGRQYLMGDNFTVADAYLFTVLRWTSRIEMDLAKWPNLKAYVDRVAARPKVQEAMKAEGLINNQITDTDTRDGLQEICRPSSIRLHCNLFVKLA